MNPDNPNFRTPEEEARAAELVKLKAELADLKWHWKQATKFVMPGEFDTAESIVEFIKRKDEEIAKLKRVIAKLTEQRNRAADRHHKQSLAKYRERIAQFEAEIAAIEREDQGAE